MMRTFHSLRTLLALFFVAVMLAVATSLPAQAPQPAPTPDDASRFTGTSTSLDATGLRATRRRFEAGARAAWHSHERGQLLFVEEGRGRVQRRGEPMRELGLHESDYTAPNVPHWHGASPGQALVQSALSWGGETKWMEKVSDDEYSGRRK